jgi:hypothetical protein
MSHGREKTQGKRVGCAHQSPGCSQGAPWEVVFHPDGHKELRLLKRQGDSDHAAVLAVIEKLKIHGPALKSPHQSGVKSDLGKGLRELRPTGGRTLVRPLYRASTTSTSSSPSGPRP